MKFGPYEIEVTARAQCRTMRLRFHPADHRLTLSVPKRATKRAIEEFLTRHRAWMDERMRDAPTWAPSYAAGERHLLLGEYVTLGQDGVPVGEEALRRYRSEALSGVLRELLPVWERRMGVRVAPAGDDLPLGQLPRRKSNPVHQPAAGHDPDGVHRAGAGARAVPPVPSQSLRRVLRRDDPLPPRLARAEKTTRQPRSPGPAAALAGTRSPALS